MKKGSKHSIETRKKISVLTMNNMSATKRDDKYRILPSGCWEWTRSLRADGYGQIRPPGRPQRTPAMLAHRWLYEMKYGSIPEGMELDHLCRNRACVNPDHLEIVTHAENDRRGLRAKISADIAKEIRTRYSQGGITHKELGHLYNISKSTVSGITNNRRWVGI